MDPCFDSLYNLKRKTVILCVLFCFLQVVAYSQETRKALFLGNSYTDVNNLPQMVSDIAANMGDNFVYDKHVPGGQTLAQHFTSAVSKSKIMAGGWDYVVLQEQSQLPSFPEYNDIPASNLVSLTRKYDPCARILFYMTWGRKNGDASNCAAWPPVCTYRGMDSLLQLRYMEMGSYNAAGVSPVGAVWRYIRDHYPAIELYQSDESHPSVAGSYAAACCFYTMMYKKSPSFITWNAGLSATEAAAIRQAATTVVFGNLAHWDHGKYMPDAYFKYKVGNGNNEVLFTNATTYAASSVWDFGDGASSGEKNPVHHYLSNGAYSVKLTAYNCDMDTTFISTHQETIHFCSHNPRIFPDSLVLCPNDQDTLWTQPYDTYQWLNAIGDTIPNETRQFIIPKGGSTYSVATTLNNCTEISPEMYVGAYSHLGTYYVNAVGNFIGTDTACIGDTVMLVLSPNKPPYPDDKLIQWLKNGLAIPSSNNDTLLITESANYKVTLQHPVCTDYVVYENSQLNYTFINCYLGIGERRMRTVITLYPNPVEDLVHLSVNSSLTGMDYKVIDLLGRSVLSGKLEYNNNELNLRSLPCGVYILQIGEGDGGLMKFVKK